MMVDIPSDSLAKEHENAPHISGQTIADQHRASNPLSSAWVSANAGSGKTYVLAQRVIRLLLNGVAPSKILCLTFTKAAAAEMSNRVFQQLSKWSRMDDAALYEELHKAGEQNPTREMLRTARLLFTRALESPGGLKIQTIHAFCEALLHQFTLEANTSGHFEVMGDYQQMVLLKDARQAVMAATLQQPQLAEALAKAMRYGSDQAIEKGLEAIIHDRQNFENWINNNNLSVETAIVSLGRHMGVDVNEPEEELLKCMLVNLPISDEELVQIGLTASHREEKECHRISTIISDYEQARSPARKFALRLSLYQTVSGNFRKKIPGVKALYAQIPEIQELLLEEVECLRQALDHYRNWKMLNGSLGLFKLADAVLQSYGQRKRSRGFLDYDDLVNRAANLLARSDVRQWVQYKLDQGIDHVLVDEAQDTSPAQWQIINAIVEEFFAGQSIQQPGSKPGRTVFAVGDQKQSIYSFQGAEPEMFARQKDILGKKAGDVKASFEDVELQISFRSTRDVLSAVDKVFSNPLNAKGLQRDGDLLIHEPIRQSDPGEVIIWPMIEHLKSDKQEDWLLPVDHVSEEHPTVQLAKRIAGTLRQWIGAGDFLPGKGRKITYGDILILVRKRDRFASAITRELKQAGLSVAGADRLNLATHIAIEDLLSLGKWVLFPEDDLSLAEVLKSPLFEFDEEDLFQVCIERQQATLWQSLCQASETSNSTLLKTARDQLAHLQLLASTTPAYEFFSEILSTNFGRRKFKARLGDEVDDVLDAFLLEALNHTSNGGSGNGGSGLQDFIHSLETASPDIKREIDLQKDEIRVMTVHSAKGLEAPIVFLVDPGSAAFSSNHRPPVIKTDYGTAYPAFLWQPGKDDGSEHTSIIHQQIAEKAEEEYRRLLYVGMTRAEDKLVICGYGNRNSGNSPTWHEMVKDSLIEDSEEILVDGEISAWRWVATHPLRKPRVEKEIEETTQASFTKLPAWACKTANREADTIPPLSPSVAAASLEAKPREQDLASGAAAPIIDGFALQRGNATHHLLQFLPRLERSTHRERAAIYLRQTYKDWSIIQRDKVCSDVIEILEDQRFSNLFSPNSHAEVGLTGILDKGGLDRRISGQIDRIAVFEDSVLIVDYKTDRFIPAKPEQISDQYLVQLAIYKELVEQIYPGKHVECALLWTSGPQITNIPEDLLSSRLDAWLREANKHRGVNSHSAA